MKDSWTVTVLLACLVTGPALNAQHLRAVDEEAIASRVHKAMQAQTIPGLSIAIGKSGRVVYDEGFGFADIENHVAATASTRFRTASIAKPMTAVAILQLTEAGKIDLDADVRRYVPDYPEKKWPIPVRALLGHLGGVRHYLYPGESSGTKHYTSLTASLECFAADPLVHAPNAKYLYTTYGYTLLGCAVEKAAASTYEKYLRGAVWEPAGMTQTCIDDEYRIVPNRARGYVVARDKAALPAALHDTSMKIPGGGLRSTASDLVRFAHALLEDKLVQRSTRDAMWTVQRDITDKPTGYGLGFSVGKFEGEAVIAHSGGQAGTACLLRILPERGHIVAVMTNREGAKLGPLVTDVLRILHSFPGEKLKR